MAEINVITKVIVNGHENARKLAILSQRTTPTELEDTVVHLAKELIHQIDWGGFYEEIKSREEKDAGEALWKSINSKEGKS